MLELIDSTQSALRALLYFVLFCVAVRRWARPLVVGMSRADCLGLLRRAKMWTAIGALGIVAHLAALADVSPALRNVPSTLLVVMIVFKGLDGLKVRRTS